MALGILVPSITGWQVDVESYDFKRTVFGFPMGNIDTRLIVATAVKIQNARL